MLKKRLIGVVTIKNKRVVQSYNYDKYLPLGSPECIVENLDRWCVDEIFVQVIDRSKRELGPDFDLIKTISSLGLSTPLIYGGGISSVEDGIKIIQLGADRLAIDSLLSRNPDVVKDLSYHIGSQALIAVLPISVRDDSLLWMDYHQRTSMELNHDMLQVLGSGVVSEIIISNWEGEGVSGSFNDKFISNFPIQQGISLIPFGGVDTKNRVSTLIDNPNVSAIAIGNFLNYSEHSVQLFKNKINNSVVLRPPTYKEEFKF